MRGASIDILGCRVDAVDRSSALTRIVALANGRPGSLVVTLGVEMVMRAQRDEHFRSIINGAALNLCDTIGLLTASRLRGGPLRERVTGVELVGDLAARSAAERDLRLYLLGGSPGVALQAAAELQRRYPGAVISGARDGYFRDEEVDEVTAAIAASGANTVCVGLGSPKQEKWLSHYGAFTGCGAGIGIGGSLDIFAGRVKRAPRIVQLSGFEWAYRLAKEPRRWRRQLALPQFVFAVAKEIVVHAGKRSL